MSEETKTTERAAPVETVGDIMSEATRATIKKLVLFLSAVVYVAAIVYAEVHGLSQLQAGVKPEMRFWATLGMIAAGISAICFPLALKSWCFDSLQRTMCTIFYIADFAFLAFNAFTDFNVQTGQQLAPWAQSYLYYVLPASPLIVGAMWAILWELDPSTRAYSLRQTLKASIMEAKAKQVAIAAKRQAVTAQVEAAADREVESALTELFGTPVTIRDPRRYEQAIPQTTQKVLHREHILWDRGDDPAAYYDPKSEYALPCGHTGGQSWDKSLKSWVCNVCGDPNNLQDHLKNEPAGQEDPWKVVNDRLEKIKQDVRSAADMIAPLTTPNYHPVPLEPKPQDEPTSAQAPFQPE
jgi:hypothetical protein